MSARCVMMLGTSSGAGKSWLTTALCRHYANQGLRVAPFKAQNMSGNARAVPLAGDTWTEAWGEISAAQYFQALAARAAPSVDMNPLLLKPDADTHSQVVLLGRANAALSASPWHDRSERVWPQVAAALERLRAVNDVVVIEGAGSPAEINLMAHDIVNLRVARAAAARCLLVADIDRGGAFAHLYGTWALLPAADRARLAGFVLNKFRGDAALLAPGPQMLQARTGVPTLAVIPMQRDIALPEEDGWFARAAVPDDGRRAQRIAVIAWPHAAALDGLEPLRQLPGIRLTWARQPQDLRAADWVLVPGTNAPKLDLSWARVSGLGAELRACAHRGTPVLGLGSGAALLGITATAYPDISAAPGLELLPRHMALLDRLSWPRVDMRLPPLRGHWRVLGGCPIRGQAAPLDTIPTAAAPAPIADIAWQNTSGNVLACALPHLLENPAVQQALFGATTPPLETAFEALAATIARCFSPGALARLIA